jgi:hypothetical chaperone protein
VKFRRLYTLIRRNLSYHVLRRIEQAKIRLSDAPSTRIEVPELDLSVEITRTEFDDYLQPYLRRIEDSVRTVLDKAELEPGSVTSIICTGGSSRIPAVQARLTGIFGKPIVEHDVFGGVAAGLAIANYHGYASPLPADMPKRA